MDDARFDALAQRLAGRACPAATCCGGSRA